MSEGAKNAPMSLQEAEVYHGDTYKEYGYF